MMFLCKLKENFHSYINFFRNKQFIQLEKSQLQYKQCNLLIMDKLLINAFLYMLMLFII